MSVPWSVLLSDDAIFVPLFALAVGLRAGVFLNGCSRAIDVANRLALDQKQCILFTIRCFACGALDREVDFL